MRKKIIYIANARLPTERAHGVQIMSMCRALADHAPVELIIPRRFNPIKVDIFSYYGIAQKFTIQKIPCLDLVTILPWLGQVAYYGEALTFAWFARRYLRNAAPGSIIYTRDLLTLAFFKKGTGHLVYEAHNLPEKAGWFFKKLLAKVDALVVITEALKTDFIKLGVSKENIIVAPDAVDPELFAHRNSLIDARRTLQLPLDKNIIMYTGHLFPWKGVYVLALAAKEMPDELFVCVGGIDTDQNKFKKYLTEQGIGNVLVLGHRPQRDIPRYVEAADVLVIPNSGTTALSSRYTSPMKLFEYMAAQRPIVASRVPALQEILDDTTATFCRPDEPSDLAAAIRLVLANLESAQAKAERAYGVVIDKYTWKKRANTILDYVRH